uniref:Translation initiation factor IF-1, chloroplastic n=1 Tax=Helicotheca tamesis TaxID=374047 RepID=A0A7S2MKM4_9STRA|mmetsp:Transcript_17512/g.24150  ORF Transcript_17512/g.24150 Transcript_17512/m.24150 type:complete len:160 (+) Transcript_17512:103-582(+)|eukprot:CAMPEP_0185723708 /NCGR_PEP_ID=MMETSP1171-20130828/461_1 /TAXON_ID=374046 /ORGANISM="Helicotheca tamensis, Strain CCMP826" /LENGTH=159 /DNA_ID=CAMNT_0028391453 /DNA_START=75 /DNA_END=554 /DNA_ORIENTATION=+
MMMKLLLLFYITCFTFFFAGTEGFSAPRITETNRYVASGPSQFCSPLSSAPFVHSSMSSTALFGKKAARAKGNDRKNKTERVKKVKDDVIEVEATVLESLPNAMFRCAIDGAPETQAPILATISGKIRKNFVKILVGDSVTIELSPYDLTRGRITFRKR